MIHLEGITKSFGSLQVLKGIDLEITQGEVVSIVGPSGAGKTTLLQIMGTLDSPDAGMINIDGTNVSRMKEKELSAFRNKHIGFVFQFYNLIPNLTALENVEIAAQLCPDSLPADQVLKAVGLGNRMSNFPAQLSGGEQQRVSIARALAKHPKLLLCDEPTGALDYETGKSILKLLQDSCRRDGMTVVIITHNGALAAMADRVIRVKSGAIHSVRMNDHVVPVEQIEW